ncbi:MAG: T9SS type A sorting domain-containing protein [Bacteroidota bacterium]
MKHFKLLFLVQIFSPLFVFSQHNNEFYNNGSLVHIQAGAEVHVLGDVHSRLATGTLENNGLIVVQGNMYSDNLFQQRGTGTTRLRNNLVNVAETQFIQGSYAVRGGQAQIGVNDGSFYNLELSNSQGIVWLNGAGNIADVRSNVDFFGTGAPVVNRIITHNPSALPANGNGYTGVFGIMNTTASLTSMLDNTVTANGNSSAIDNGYVQGKLRRAVNPAGGTYGYVLGLQPAGAGASRGMQYIHLNFGANNYDVVEGYFQQGSTNVVAGTPIECSGNTVNYFGGADHGEWVFNDVTGGGAGTYEVRVWPQDHTMPTNSIWVITKDDQLVGTADDCGPSPVGLDRAGFNGFSEFGVAAVLSALPAELLQIWAVSNDDNIQTNWTVGSEINLSYYVLERSTNAVDFDSIATLVASGNSTVALDYQYSDFNVQRGIMYYYRYRSVDYNGTEEYSPIVNGKLAAEGDLVVELYPNPANDEINIYFESSIDRKIELTLYDAQGKLISKSPATIANGSNVIPMNLYSLTPGMYTIRLEDLENQQLIHKRFIKN